MNTKNYIFPYFYRQYLVLFTMAPLSITIIINNRASLVKKSGILFRPLFGREAGPVFLIQQNPFGSFLFLILLLIIDRKYFSYPF